MTIETVAQYITNNGMWILFLLVALEYLGIPGYPGGIMLPAIGVIARMGLTSVQYGTIIAIISGSVTMVAVYIVGLVGGRWVVEKLGGNKRFVQTYDYMQRMTAKHGNLAVFLVRLVPVIRTFGSITAGVLGMEWRSYCIYSFGGNLIYTLAAVGLGYYATALFI